ncbi:MAG TPA: M67 family metallopeptidase [Candidatus Binatia bacterium]|jgi:proteasome lid subunit RPN8/RPN11
MDPENPLVLNASAWTEISRHAEETFPEECCGIIFSGRAGDEVRRLKNIQNQLHALDPVTYPRTAAIAYAMDPMELESIVEQGQRAGARLKAFYHSHPDCEAYFSEEDKAFACPFGEPTFPDTAQIVISVYDRKVKRIAAFTWSEEKNDFVETALEKDHV